jgi:hypothetical protein
MLRCTTCKKNGSESEFYRNKAMRSGFSNQCRLCFRESNKRSRTANVERVRHERVEYRKRNPDKIRELSRASRERRYALFPDVFRDKGLAAYYRAHKNQPCVYLVGADPAGSGPVKIGHTCNLPVRLRMLQCGSPSPLLLIAERRFDTKAEAKLLERQLRQGFVAHRLHGEWFSPAPEVLECLSARL